MINHYCAHNMVEKNTKNKNRIIARCFKQCFRILFFFFFILENRLEILQYLIFRIELKMESWRIWELLSRISLEMFCPMRSSHSYQYHNEHYQYNHYCQCWCHYHHYRHYYSISPHYLHQSHSPHHPCPCTTLQILNSGTSYCAGDKSYH